MLRKEAHKRYQNLSEEEEENKRKKGPGKISEFYRRRISKKASVSS